MTKLSFCAIVKNEEYFLKKCLKSVKDVVNEIVILDTGSTDKTVEIAREFGANIFSFAWGNDFSAARNEALKYVTGDWILVLDADETLNQKVGPDIHKLIAESENLVINLIRQEVGAVQSPYSLVSRLFRNHPEVKFSHPYHATIDESVLELFKKEPHWKIVDLPLAAIFHYGYQPQAIEALDKTNRAREAMESFLKTHPNDPYTCSKLAGIYLQIGREKEGIKLLKRGLKSNLANAHVLYELHYHYANACARNKQVEAAAKHYQKAIKQPILPKLKLGAYNNFGSLLQLTGNLLEAEKAYRISLDIDPTFAISYYNLGIVLKAKGQFQAAIAVYQKAIQLDPNYIPAYKNLGVLFLSIGNFSASADVFKQAIALYEAQNPQEAERLRQELQELGIV